MGLGGLLLVLVISFFTGINPLELVSAVEPSSGTSLDRSAPADDEGSRFVRVVLADTEDTWNEIFARNDLQYREPTLVLFTDSVQSACGFSSAAVGPFYCPTDGKVYLDLSFFDQLKRRFGAPGDFAQAYVIAHEVGHHVQNLLDISDRVRRQQQQAASQQEANELSIRLELQADCLAGVWGATANRERRLLEPGDIEEGLAAAAAIGDDQIQRKTQGYVVPESWTHGSSEMRVEWFKRGLQTGDPNTCDTFQGIPLG